MEDKPKRMSKLLKVIKLWRLKDSLAHLLDNEPDIIRHQIIRQVKADECLQKTNVDDD